LPIVDRMIAPVAQRLDQMDERQREDTRTLHNKLDQLAAVAHRVQSHDDAVDDLKGRMEGVETVQVAQQAAMNKMTGRNEVIMWLLGGIGGPVVVALVLAGIASLFNIKFGG